MIHETVLATPRSDAADGQQDVADVRRITGSQLGAALAQAQLAKVLGTVGFGFDIAGLDHPGEDLVEASGVHRLNVNLVVDDLQEGFVRQVGGCKV